MSQSVPNPLLNQNKNSRAAVAGTRSLSKKQADMAEGQVKYGFDRGQKKLNFLRNLTANTASGQEPEDSGEKTSSQLKFPPIKTKSLGISFQDSEPKPPENVKLPRIDMKPIQSQQRGMHYPNLPPPEMTEQLYPNTPKAWAPSKRIEKPRAPIPTFNFMKPTQSFQNWAQPKTVFPVIPKKRPVRLPPLVIPKKVEPKTTPATEIRENLIWESPGEDEPISFRKVRVNPEILARRSWYGYRPKTPLKSADKKAQWNPPAQSQPQPQRRCVQKIKPREKSLTFPEWKAQRDLERQREWEALELKEQQERDRMRQKAVAAMKEQYVEVMTQYLVKEELQQYLKASGMSDLIMSVMFAHQRGSEYQLQEALIFLNTRFRELGVEISMRKTNGKVMIKYFEEEEQPVGFQNLPLPEAMKKGSGLFGAFGLQMRPKKVICIPIITPPGTAPNDNSDEIDPFDDLDLEGNFDETEVQGSFDELDFEVDFDGIELKEKPATASSEYTDCTDSEEVLVGDQY